MSETITDTKTRLEAFVEQTFPDADIAPGTVLSELLIKLSATLQNEIYNKITEFSEVSTVQEALASATDTYSETIDEVASNFDCIRSTGQASEGVVKITVAAFKNYNIPATFTLEQSNIGLSYLVLQRYIAVTATPSTTSELQIFTDGTVFFFYLPVTAADVGGQFQISSGTKLSPDVTSLFDGFVDAEAYGNFSVGVPKETDKQLIARFKETLSNTTLSSPVSINKYLKEKFPTVVSVSVIGANDPEMLRSKQNIFGISTFGKADIYVRTSLSTESIRLTKTGTKLSSGLWQISFAQDDAPGFYRITSVLPRIDNKILDGNLVSSSLVYSYQNIESSRNNELHNAEEARFTKYQTATYQFFYSEFPAVANASTASFDVVLSYQPFVKEIQDVFLDTDTRVLCSDYLVKAALPCFVSLKINLLKKSSFDTEESVGINNLKKEIFNYINTIPFGEVLSASTLVDICHNYSIKRVDLPIIMTGEIVGTDDSVTAIQSEDILTIPFDIDKGISPNTSLFFIDYYRQLSDGSTNTIENMDITLI